MANEKKQDYGKMQIQFQVSAEVKDPSGNCFLTLNRFKGPGKFQPVYKTECKPLMKGRFTWNMIIMDTDTLCDNVTE